MRVALLLKFQLAALIIAFGLTSALGAQSTAATPATEMQLRPGDIVRISVWRQEDFSGEFTITADGRIAHPLYGNINVLGKSLRQVETEVGTFLRTFEENPQFVMEPLVRVSVSGQVDRPSVYAVTPGTTAAEAVAQAGGITEQGRADNVRLVRQRSERFFDLRNPGEGSIQLLSGDEIFVGTKRQWFRNVVVPVATIVGAITSIVIAARRDF